MKQIKNYFVLAVLSVALLHLVVFVPTATAAREINMEIVAPNKMTPEMSRQIHLKKQFIKAVMIAVPAIIITFFVIKVVKTRKKVQASASTTKRKR